MFTLADFSANEDENYHTENGIEMAKHFGTPEELELMMQIQKDHYARGHIEPSEIEARNAIVQKYWHHLSGVEDIKEDVAEVKSEVKRRVKRVKEELKDVKEAGKNLAKQSKDVVEAVKGGNRKGRKPANKKRKPATKK